jgi:hypothetical protein
VLFIYLAMHVMHRILRSLANGADIAGQIRYPLHRTESVPRMSYDAPEIVVTLVARRSVL